jgi:hypothetical protein
MPTKLGISDGDFCAISWNCLHGLSVMGGVPSVPYILPNSLIILTAKACMKLYLIVWLWNALRINFGNQTYAVLSLLFSKQH